MFFLHLEYIFFLLFSFLRWASESSGLCIQRDYKNSVENHQKRKNSSLCTTTQICTKLANKSSPFVNKPRNLVTSSQFWEISFCNLFLSIIHISRAVSTLVNWPKLAQTIPPSPSITASESAKLWWVIAHPWKTFAVITTIEITILANNKILDRKLSRFIVSLCKKLSGNFGRRGNDKYRIWL